MRDYIIKEIEKDGYSRFLLLLSTESIFDYLDSIENSPNMINATGKVLIDQLFITGVNSNRFISCELQNGRLDLKTACVVCPTEDLRKETIDWLQDNYEYVENSILTESQRQKVKDGIIL